MAIEPKYLHLCLLALSIDSVKRSNYKGAIIAATGAGIIGNLIAQSMTVEVPHLQRKEINLIGHMMYVREDFADAILSWLMKRYILVVSLHLQEV